MRKPTVGFGSKPIRISLLHLLIVFWILMLALIVFAGWTDPMFSPVVK